jgi:hypothetical protein
MHITGWAQGGWSSDWGNRAFGRMETVLEHRGGKIHAFLQLTSTGLSVLEKSFLVRTMIDDC